MKKSTIPSRSFKPQLWLIAAFLLTFTACAPSSNDNSEAEPANSSRVLVFSKTAGYHHESIPAGIAAIQELGREAGFSVDSSSTATLFTTEGLTPYQAVIFLNTSEDVLNEQQQAAFEKYIQAGGGFVGIHAASDTEYEWPWYGKLVGAWFHSHPDIQQANILVTEKQHPATRHLPDQWQRTDEWYNFKNMNADVQVIAWLDESSYEGGIHGTSHPFAWYHEYDGGRAFYTAGGHTTASYSEPLFRQHLLGGILYAIGQEGTK